MTNNGTKYSNKIKYLKGINPIWMIILGTNCSKNKKSKIVEATKKMKNKLIRYIAYSLVVPSDSISVITLILKSAGLNLILYFVIYKAST